jgi:hypothetical protein
MNLPDTQELDALLRTFRRQVALATSVRIALIVLLGIGLFWSMQLPQETGRRMTLAVLGLGLLMVVLATVGTLRLTRDVQAGNMMMSRGRPEEAAIWLRRALSRFTISTQGKFIAAQQMGMVLLRQDAYTQVVSLCREMLRHRLSRWRSVWFAVRVMLADSLLMLHRESEAYEALRPVFIAPMSLLERMRILPVQLRYELASNNTASSVQDLEKKTQIAELLDAPRAALVHALLAEACDRESMPEARDYFLQRAWLYHDLNRLARRYDLLAPLAAKSMPGDLNRLKETAASDLNPTGEASSQEDGTVSGGC